MFFNQQGGDDYCVWPFGITSHDLLLIKFCKSRQINFIQIFIKVFETLTSAKTNKLYK